MDDYSYGTFNTADPKETIIVVFGSNKGNGSRYELKTHDKTYNEDISDQQDVLKVYRLFNKDTQGMNTWGTLTVYDKDNNEIDLYK